VGWVDPGLARDSVATFTAAQDLWRAVGRANILITIPATTQGLQAFRSLITEGINVHVALIPSERRYRQTLDAYVAALETRQGRGLPLAVHSVASLAALACTPDGTALADAAWRIFEAQGATPRLRQLVRLGAEPQRLALSAAQLAGLPDAAAEHTVCALHAAELAEFGMRMHPKGADAPLSPLGPASAGDDDDADDLMIKAALAAEAEAYQHLESAIGTRLTAVRHELHNSVGCPVCVEAPELRALAS
jgi:hypothetical protein